MEAFPEKKKKHVKIRNGAGIPTGLQSWIAKKVMTVFGNTGKKGLRVRRRDQNIGEACEEEEEGMGQAMGGEEEVGIEDKVEHNE
jgi:hypothetical protein